MRVTTGVPAGEAQAGALTGLWGLDELVEQPARRYRRRFTIDLPTGGLTEALLFLESALADLVPSSESSAVTDALQVLQSTVATVSFSNRDFDALAAGAPEVATLSLRGGDLVVTLPVARRLLRVKLANPQSGDKVAAFRFDGDVVAEEAVDTGAHGSQGAPLNVTDRQLILRRRNAGSTTALAISDVAQVVLRVDPHNPRVLIRIAEDPEGERPLSLAAGAGAGNTEDLGPQLAAALEDQIARFQAGRQVPTLPSPLTLELAFEADSPCRLQIHDFGIGYYGRRASFPDAEPKKVLRFKGGRRETRALPIMVPAAITAVSAQLRLAGDLGGGGAAGQGPQSGPGAEETPAPFVPSKIGIALTPDRPLAASIQPDAAAAVDMAFTEIAVIEPATTLVMSLWRDAGGRPGDLLTESAPLETGATAPSLFSFSFRRPAVLSADRFWAGLRVVGGRAVWMMAPAADASLLELHDRNWRQTAAGAGLAPVLHLPALAASAADEGIAAGAMLDDQPLVLTRVGPDTLVDFTAGATARAAVGPAGSEVDLSILISSTGKGPVTAFPPQIVYDLS